MKITSLLFMLLLMLLGNIAFGNTMRCGVYLVGNNSTQYEVLKKCGEPTHRDGYDWYYESSTQFTRVVSFNGQGKVMYIKQLDDN